MEVDAVIVGGGAAGCSTLYHLAKLGITNAVLLETHALTAGTSWHTAGKLTFLNLINLKSNEIKSDIILNLNTLL